MPLPNTFTQIIIQLTQVLMCHVVYICFHKKIMMKMEPAIVTLLLYSYCVHTTRCRPINFWKKKVYIFELRSFPFSFSLTLPQHYTSKHTPLAQSPMASSDSKLTLDG